MLLTRLLCIAIALALIDAAAATFGTSTPALHWSAVGVTILYAGLLVFGWRRLADITAAVGLFLLAALIALGGPLGGTEGGIALTGIGSQSVIALEILAALLLGGFVTAISRAPAIVRIAVPILVLVAGLPFVVAVYEGTLDPAFSGALGYVGWAAVEVLLPLAALAVIVIAVVLAIRKNWTRAASLLIVALAILACAHAGMHEAALRGMPVFALAMLPHYARSMRAA